MSALLELAERCEQATAGGGKLDMDIFRAVYERPYLYSHLDDEGPAFTTSLDAAMTLVPEGWRLRQMNFSGPCADDRKWHLNLHGGREGRDVFVGRGQTPALALCAAALRARASTTSATGRVG